MNCLFLSEDQLSTKQKENNINNNNINNNDNNYYHKNNTLQHRTLKYSSDLRDAIFSHAVNSIWSILIPDKIYQLQFQIYQFQFQTPFYKYLLRVPTWNIYSK